MGLTDGLERFHRFHGLRATGMGRELELEWPSHPVYPSTDTWCAGATSTRWWPRTRSPPGQRCSRATRRSQPIVDAASCVAPSVDRTDGGDADDIRAEFTSSPTVPTAASAGRSARSAPRSGRTAPRSARTGSRRATPSRGSSRPSTSRIATATRCPGYGWIFPVGDGTVNIGVGLLSTFRDFKSVNTTPPARRLRPPDRRAVGDRPGRPECRATSGRIPMGGSVGPKAGPDVPRRRRRRRQRQPVQRRGHRLRLRDGSHGRRVLHEALVAATRRRCSATRRCSTTSTASTSRWPACSPA